MIKYVFVAIQFWLSHFVVLSLNVTSIWPIDWALLSATHYGPELTRE